MNVTIPRVRAVAKSIHISGIPEAAGLLRAVEPFYQDGLITWKALIAACRFLYAGYDLYSPLTKANLLHEARRILYLAEVITS
jgi:hypothetical protein